jgi:hypothetical protein
MREQARHYYLFASSTTTATGNLNATQAGQHYHCCYCTLLLQDYGRYPPRFASVSRNIEGGSMGPFFDSGRDSRPTLLPRLRARINITSISDGAPGTVDLPQMPVDPRSGSKFEPPDQGRDSAIPSDRLSVCSARWSAWSELGVVCSIPHRGEDPSAALCHCKAPRPAWHGASALGHSLSGRA